MACQNQHCLITEDELKFFQEFMGLKRQHLGIAVEEFDEEYITGGSYEDVSYNYGDVMPEEHAIHDLPVEWTREGIEFNYGSLSETEKPVILLRRADKEQLENRRQIVLQFLLDYFNVRTYERSFFLLLLADIYILLQDRNSYEIYYNSISQLIDYCRKKIDGAPCNPDCLNYRD